VQAKILRSEAGGDLWRPEACHVSLRKLDNAMDHNLFLQLRAVLNQYYLPAPAPPVVGYLRGSASPGIWRAKIAERNEQLMLLGNAEPTAADWANAGVEHRTGETQRITLPMLNGFVLTYGGFMAGRPWAAICDENVDSVTIGFPNALASFEQAIARNGQ
jgi:hypothetical protein